MPQHHSPHTDGVPRPEHQKNAPTADIHSEMEGWLTIDVYQTPTEIVVESAVAGVKPEDIDVRVTPDSVSIKGSRRHEASREERDYLYQECYWGNFSRSVVLPQDIDPEAATVTLKNGILTVRLPKSEKKKERKIPVKTV